MDITVREVMTFGVETIFLAATLEQAVGLLTSDNLAEFFMLQTALEQSRQHKQPQAA